MIDKLLQWDKELFVFLNGLGSGSYDGLWLLITNQLCWIPVFLFILYLVFRHLGWRHALLILVIIGILVTLTDQTTNIFKYGVHRLRPCNNPELEHIIRIVKKSHSSGFFSAHAANSMGVALFLYRVMKPYLKYMGFIFLWPLIFAYSRIYLGLHYPSDILCGYLWGILMSLLVFEIYKFSRDKFFPHQKENLDYPTHA